MMFFIATYLLVFFGCRPVGLQKIAAAVIPFFDVLVIKTEERPKLLEYFTTLFFKKQAKTQRN